MELETNIFDRFVEMNENEPSELGFVMLKPLGAQSPIREKIIEKVKEIGVIVYSEKHVITEEEASALYWRTGHENDGSPKPHFHAIVEYLKDKEVELLIISGEKVTERIDEKIGHWQPENAEPGQIRHLVIEDDLEYIIPVDTPDGSNNYVCDNLIHSSDSPEAAMEELSVFFAKE